MNIHKEKILKLLGKERVVTSSEVAKELKISWNTAEKYLLELIIEGKVEKIKKEGVNLWLERRGR
jgi:Mn-dependent DtxR family transcriptional regulator